MDVNELQESLERIMGLAQIGARMEADDVRQDANPRVLFDSITAQIDGVLKALDE